MSWNQNSINNTLATTSLTGVLQAAQFPALTGDVTTTAGSLVTTIAASAVTTSKINNNAVTYAKIQASSVGAVLLGNPTGSAGNYQEVTLGAGFSFAGSVLNYSGTFAKLPQTIVSGTSATMAANNGYIANNASLVTLTLPSSASVGDIVQVSGQGVGGWKIAQTSGQSIIFNCNTTTVGTGGSISSTLPSDTLTIMCTVANTTFNVISSQGNFTGI